jgi:hypothetical protein
VLAASAAAVDMALQLPIGQVLRHPVQMRPNANARACIAWLVVLLCQHCLMVLLVLMCG